MLSVRTLRAGFFCGLLFGLSAIVQPLPAADAHLEVAATLELLEQELEIARLRLRLFERVDYPLRIRELDRQIRVGDAELESLKRKIAEYERFKTKAFFADLENLRIRLLDTELRLQDLKYEKLLLQAHRRDELRLRELQIRRAGRSSANLPVD